MLARVYKQMDHRHRQVSANNPQTDCVMNKTRPLLDHQKGNITFGLIASSKGSTYTYMHPLVVDNNPQTHSLVVPVSS
jgi:hypothetical protein